MNGVNISVHPVKHRHWSPVTEYALLLGSGVGAVISLAANSTVAASLPVTILVALGLLNRRRIDQSIDLTEHKLEVAEEKVTNQIAILTDRVSTLPTPQVVANYQRAAMNHSERAVARFSQALEQTQQGIEHRIEQLEMPDLSHLYQDVAQLQEQYTYVCTTLNSLSRQFERLSTLTRIEATEDDIIQLKTELMQLRVNLETLTMDNRTSQATLQDAVRHLDRRLRQIPNLSDPNLLKSEVRALVRTVSDLVPRRDFAALAEQISSLRETQEVLRCRTEQLQTATGLEAYQAFASSNDARLKALESTLSQLSSGLQQMETRLEDVSVPFDITAEIRGTTATYLSSFQWQLALLEQKTQDLIQQHEELAEVPLPDSLARGNAQSSTGDNLQWLVAVAGEGMAQGSSAADQALLSALDEASERLTLVWPWSTTLSLNDHLIERFSKVLERQCRLEIGWCHVGDRQAGCLLKPITQQWGITTAQRQLLKSTLNQLLPLRQSYPEQFAFKVLGTDEPFFVCDRTYAVVGLQSLSTTVPVSPKLDLRLKTTEPSVISQLLQRFDAAELQPGNAAAAFNRAATRYDLQDLKGATSDFSQVLRIHASDAVALNNRGVVLVEQKANLQAIRDFNQALTINSDLFAARCNRGWLLMRQGELNPALEDFDQAIIIDPTSAVPYFYRGTIRQKLRDNHGAIADYTHAILNSRQVAFLYCYRGAAYQRQGDISRAVTDLEIAASLLYAQGDHRSLTKVTQVLASLKRAELPQRLRLQSA